MPRQARKKSQTGIHHIMLRGIDGRNIFLDEEDKTIFLKKLLATKENVNFGLYGYCLMDNHIHLIIEEAEEIGISMKRITVGYVHWHNNKYARTGHLFQNRYLSEPVETDKYLLAALRYIHNNPLKAMLVKHMKDYLWSSYNQYIALYNKKVTNVDGQLITAYLKNKEEFEEFMHEDDNRKLLQYKPVKKYTDIMLNNIIQKEFSAEIFNLSMEERNQQIREVYQNTGVSIRQLAT